jgi:hypothetical protein
VDMVNKRGQSFSFPYLFPTGLFLVAFHFGFSIRIPRFHRLNKEKNFKQKLK